MKSFFLSFLDLVTLFLAVMIVVVSVSSRQTGGAGLLKAVDDWEVIEVEYERGGFPTARPVAVSADVDAASLFFLQRQNTVILVVSARRNTDDTGNTVKTKISMPHSILNLTSDIRWWDKDSSAPKTSKGYTLAQRNDSFKTVAFVSLEKRSKKHALESPGD